MSTDTDFAESSFVAPLHAVELFAKIVPTDACIIEFGCGTGMVGELLAQKKYQQPIGLVSDAQTREKATERNCYLSLREHDLTGPLADDVRYDAGICVGVCGFGSVKATHLVHMNSVLVEHAPLILTIDGRAWTDQNWAEQLEDAQQADRFDIEYINTIPYLADEGIDGKLLIIRNSHIEIAREP